MARRCVQSIKRVRMGVRFRSGLSLAAGLIMMCCPVRIQPVVAATLHKGMQLGLQVSSDAHVGVPKGQVVTVYGIRKFPYPYDAMLAISSDADHQTLRKFMMIHRFLNTTEKTSFGRGLGLDIGDSFFLFNGSVSPNSIDYGHVPGSEEMSYYRGTTTVPWMKPVIDEAIGLGWIDSLHSFGDFTAPLSMQTQYRPELAGLGLKGLLAAGDLLTVWTDHGNQQNVDNFSSRGLGRIFRYQQGASPHSPYYHLNLLRAYGVRFIWREVAGNQLGHAHMAFPVRLQDGEQMWAFSRYTYKGLTRTGAKRWVWSIDSLASVLTQSNLQALEKKHQYAIIAQHFCADNTPLPLPQNAVYALRRLAREQARGRILVARTSRLLQYDVAQRFVQVAVRQDKTRTIINVLGIRDPLFGDTPPTPSNLAGLTFYVADPAHTVLEMRGVPLAPDEVQRNPSDEVHPSIEVRWKQVHV